jgi:hypothetical protein
MDGRFIVVLLFVKAIGQPYAVPRSLQDMRRRSFFRVLL